jgi:hypothetical protein
LKGLFEAHPAVTLAKEQLVSKEEEKIYLAVMIRGKATTN